MNIYSYDQFDGDIQNDDIISLRMDLDDALADVRRIQKEIETIQSKCNHEYMFCCRGAYEDSYTCKKCGHETEK